MQPGSVHGHALLQISRGIWPSLPADYLILSAKACFGCGQRAYCQPTEPAFIMQDKGESHGDPLFCAALALVAVSNRDLLALSQCVIFSMCHILKHSVATPSFVFHIEMSNSSTFPSITFARLKLFLISRGVSLRSAQTSERRSGIGPAGPSATRRLQPIPSLLGNRCSLLGYTILILKDNPVSRSSNTTTGSDLSR